MSVAADLQIALPEVLLAVSAMALLIFGVYQGKAAAGRVMVLSAATLVAVIAIILVREPAGIAFGGLYVDDGFGDYMKLLLLIGALLVLIMSHRYLELEQANRFEYSVLLLFATLGMMVMVSANDLISLYIGLELQSLALYVVAAIRRDNARSSEAGLKYFVLGALASGLLLYGMSMIYGFSGTTSFEALAEILAAPDTEPSLGLIVGLVFICAGLAFKVSAVPFHMWTPDVYEGAPTSVTAFFAVAPKIAAIALFTRVLMGPFHDLVDAWQQIIVFISIASMVLGAFAAIAQNNIKRLMAYSSIGHIGYALVGLAAGTPEGVSGVGAYMAIYLVMNVGTFACILSMRQNGRMVEGVNDLKGISRTNPLIALALLIFMFSLAGIPPMAGFWAKFWVFKAAIGAELYGLAVIGVLASVVSAFYYLRIVKLMYFDEATEGLDKGIGRETGLIIVATAAATILLFAMPGAILEGADAAATSLTHYAG